jgi:hypothetical protein
MWVKRFLVWLMLLVVFAGTDLNDLQDELHPEREGELMSPFDVAIRRLTGGGPAWNPCRDSRTREKPA